MSEESFQQITSFLSGQNIEVRLSPGREEISEVGFYLEPGSMHIEHWSLPCDYNRCMVDHFSNKNGLVNDGFKAVLAFDDIDRLVQSMHEWKLHLIKYGVI